MGKETKNGRGQAGLGSVVQLLERFIATASASTCFSSPVEVGDRTIIPVAEVVTGFGAGGGGGEGKEEPEPGAGNSDAKDMNSGEGGGGGGFTRSRPVAVVVIAPEGVTVEPVVDATQIAMAGLAAGAFVGFWFVRMLALTEAQARKEKAPSLKSIAGAIKRM
jgi:uncharacterized spore protein YtfJ